MRGARNDWASLNVNQQKAALWDKGPLLVLAGSGAGKTRVLTYRLANILANSPGKHFRLLVLSRTNKGAAEMRSRVAELVPDFPNRVNIAAFHSYAAEFLRQYGSHIGVRPDFQMLSDDVDREKMLAEVIAKVGKKPEFVIPDNFQASLLLPCLTNLFELSIAPEKAADFLSPSQPDAARELALICAAYREELQAANFMDHPALISAALSLAENCPFIPKHVRRIYTHVLVDDFQEVKAREYELLKKFVAPDPSTFFAAADDEQIFGQGDGADPKRIERLKTDFGVDIVQLPENYRCPPEILSLANSLIAFNHNGREAKRPLVSVKSASRDLDGAPGGAPGGAIIARQFSDAEEEMEWLAHDLAEKNLEERERCAILARSTKMLEKMGQKLFLAHIPAYFPGRNKDFLSAPFRMLLAILRLANRQSDKKALAQLNKAFFELEGADVSPSEITFRASAGGLDWTGCELGWRRSKI
ncbi:MAG: ATP-dependent helicase [Deltaproteobacteria bacterium]|jgi:DNA helicase-2/ATP-dependent DNA helicase PcrA|nr:ATP-dependent helicase [Deltaproteobacteria bacterium]